MNFPFSWQVLFEQVQTIPTQTTYTNLLFCISQFFIINTNPFKSFHQNFVFCSHGFVGIYNLQNLIIRCFNKESNPSPDIFTFRRKPCGFPLFQFISRNTNFIMLFSRPQCKEIIIIIVLKTNCKESIR